MPLFLCFVSILLFFHFQLPQIRFNIYENACIVRLYDGCIRNEVGRRYLMLPCSISCTRFHKRISEKNGFAQWNCNGTTDGLNLAFGWPFFVSAAYLKHILDLSEIAFELKHAVIQFILVELCAALGCAFLDTWSARLTDMHQNHRMPDPDYKSEEMFATYTWSWRFFAFISFNSLRDQCIFFYSASIELKCSVDRYLIWWRFESRKRFMNLGRRSYMLDEYT